MEENLDQLNRISVSFYSFSVEPVFPAFQYWAYFLGEKGELLSLPAHADIFFPLKQSFNLH